MSGDRTKLPKWAQRELERLERDLESAQQKLAAGPEDSNTFADPYAAAPRPLGRDVAVEFHTGSDRDERVIVRVDGDKVNIYGGDSLRIFPMSSNVIEVQPKRFGAKR
jgi:hypothetical protein